VSEKRIPSLKSFLPRHLGRDSQVQDLGSTNKSQIGSLEEPVTIRFLLVVACPLLASRFVSLLFCSTRSEISWLGWKAGAYPHASRLCLQLRASSLVIVLARGTEATAHAPVAAGMKRKRQVPADRGGRVSGALAVQAC